MTLIKKISAATVMMGMIQSVYAVAPGFYFGTMFGMTNLNSPIQTIQLPTTPPSSTTLTPESNGIGARLFLGGNFNLYSGMEFGYTYYSAGTYKSTVVTNNIRAKANSLDILGKGMFPIAATGITIFGKFGGAYINNRTTGSVGGVKPKASSSTFRPVLGMGVSYDITQHWVADLSYTRILYKTTYVRNPSLMAVGISYHIVDEYCGQFLC
jgi:opacity protein-like surface antigen